jgi:hypothetical protein
MRPRTVLSIILQVTLFSAAAAAQGVNDGHGKEWRQLTETTLVSWNQVAQVCPRDGVSACSGVAGTRDLTGWVWATKEQVIELFSYYEPAILTSPTFSVSGQPYFFTASGFLSAIRPTFSFAITYQSGQFAAGWTASTDAGGLPIAGSVGVGTTPVSISGSFGVGSVSNPNEVRADRGVFLWRSTGLGGAVIANDDTGSVPSPAGGTAIASVLANDWLSGVRATTANVRLTQQSSSSAGVRLDLADGSIDVFAGTLPGTHTLIYQICEIANPTNCDQARATVTVPPYVINAVNDQGTASPSVGGVAVANVLVNDTLGGARATTATVRLAQQSSTSTGITLDLADGSVDVAPGTTIGTHTLVYQICEIANPANCDPATVTVVVKPFVVNAVNDYARASSKRPGTAIASVLANDWLGNMRATPANVRLSLLSLSPPTSGIVLDLADGSVDVTKKVNSVTYSLVYQICEIASPSNCDQATVTLELSGGD